MANKLACVIPLMVLLSCSNDSNEPIMPIAGESNLSSSVAENLQGTSSGNGSSEILSSASSDKPLSNEVPSAVLVSVWEKHRFQVMWLFGNVNGFVHLIFLVGICFLVDVVFKIQTVIIDAYSVVNAFIMCCVVNGKENTSFGG